MPSQRCRFYDKSKMLKYLLFCRHVRALGVQHFNTAAPCNDHSRLRSLVGLFSALLCRSAADKSPVKVCECLDA